MFELNGYQRDVLLILAGNDGCSGVTIRTELADYYESETHAPRAYQTLIDLEERGYVNRGKIDGRTNKYTLTDHAWSEIERYQQWAAEMWDKEPVEA